MASRICSEDCPKFGSVKTALSFAEMIPKAEHPVSAIDVGPVFAGKGKGDGEAVAVALAVGLRLIFRRGATTFFWALHMVFTSISSFTAALSASSSRLLLRLSAVVW